MKPMVRVYADGGKIVEREYGGNPTFGKAVAANFGVGDGYSYRPKKAEKKAPQPRGGMSAEPLYKNIATGKVSKEPGKKPREMNVGNAAVEFGNVMAKRKAALDET